MAKSSINIQIATIFALLHNLRVAIVSYTIAKADRNDCNRGVEEAYAYYLALVKEAVSNYTSRTGQKIQTNEKRFLWEAVINLNENHTLEDMEKLAVVLEKIYGWRSIQNSIHRDEGHIDLESGEKRYNYHGHMVLFMLDEKGIYRFKKRDFGIKKMEGLQTLTAKVLNMERGISKKITKKVRMDHRQYRQFMQYKDSAECRIQDLINEVDGMYNEYNNLLHQSAQELVQLQDLYDKQLVEMSELEKWKEHIQNDILNLKVNGKIDELNILNQYLPVSVETIDNTLHNPKLLSSLDSDEFYFEDDYDFTQGKKL